MLFWFYHVKAQGHNLRVCPGCVTDLSFLFVFHFCSVSQTKESFCYSCRTYYADQTSPNKDLSIRALQILHDYVFNAVFDDTPFI